MSRGPLREGETVLLLDEDNNAQLLTLETGARYHFHLGSLAHDDLIGGPEGAHVRTSTGRQLVVFRPRLIDFVLEMPRKTAIVAPKDLAALIFWADIFPGATVLEVGLGSASLTIALLRAVGPEGRVISYETRAELIPSALANIHRLIGEPSNLLVREHDVYTGVLDRGIDRLLLDLAEPWRVVPLAAEALEPGGVLAGYTPSVIQAKRLVEALREGGFGQVETFETLVRPWHIQADAVRPYHQMQAHTAFLTVARLQGLGVRGRGTGLSLVPDP